MIGSKTSPEAAMWLNPQSWSVISRAATPEQGQKAMQTVALTWTGSEIIIVKN